MPGKANVTAHAPSRNVAVAAVSEITNFSREELFAAQRQDPLWSDVVYALESGVVCFTQVACTFVSVFFLVYYAVLCQFMSKQ